MYTTSVKRESKPRRENAIVEEWTVLWCSNGWPELRERFAAKLPSWIRCRGLDPSKSLLEQVALADVLIPISAIILPEILDAAPRTKLIVNPTAGHNGLPLEECKIRRIPAAIFPGGNGISVAEAAIGSILALAKRVKEQQQCFQNMTLGQPFGMELRGKTLGIIGMGAIGRHVAMVGTALGMTILGINSGSSRQDFEALLHESHIITIHAPLNKKTLGLIGWNEIAMMRPGVLLVNYGRGAVIDELALTEGVASGKIGGLWLDVFAQEPEDPTKPLYQYPNVTCTPHTGASTEDCMDRLATFLATNVIRKYNGQDLYNEVVLHDDGKVECKNRYNY